MKTVLETAGERPTRRLVLSIALPALSAAGFLWWRRNLASHDPLPASDSGEEVSLVEFSDAGARLGLRQVRKVVRSDSDWWARMTPQQYYVTRNHSTDTPYTGTYYRMHDDGLFRCICCENALFRSEAKYDSGTGWPSFWAPIANENVRTLETSGLSRHDALRIGIEVLCKLCDAHLGHIFDDGSAPTNLRYCINESALHFVRRNGPRL